MKHISINTAVAYFKTVFYSAYKPFCLLAVHPKPGLRSCKQQFPVSNYAFYQNESSLNLHSLTEVFLQSDFQMPLLPLAAMFPPSGKRNKNSGKQYGTKD